MQISRFPEVVVSAHCLPSRLTAMSEGEARPALEDELGRVLIKAQIAAPLFMGHLHRLSKKLHSLLSSIRRIIQPSGHSCADPRPSRRAANSVGSGEMIEFLAHMPTDTMLFLTMAVLGLAATLIVLRRLI
jgi:hypothetical protein